MIRPVSTRSAFSPFSGIADAIPKPATSPELHRVAGTKARGPSRQHLRASSLANVINKAYPGRITKKISNGGKAVHLYTTSIPDQLDFRSALETTPPQGNSNTSAPSVVDAGEHASCFESIVVSFFFSAKRSFSVAS